MIPASALRGRPRALRESDPKKERKKEEEKEKKIVRPASFDLATFRYLFFYFGFSRCTDYETNALPTELRSLRMTFFDFLGGLIRIVDLDLDLSLFLFVHVFAAPLLPSRRQARYPRTRSVRLFREPASLLRLRGAAPEVPARRRRGEGERGVDDDDGGGRGRRKQITFDFFSFSSSSSIPRARAFPPSLQRLCASLSPWAVKVRCICPPSRSTAALSERHGGENGFPRNGRASFVDHRMRRRRNGRFWSCRYSTQSPREPLLLAFFSLDGLR